MNNIFLDTSILSEICWIKHDANLECSIQILNNWNSLINQVNEQIPNLLLNEQNSEIAFQWITSDLLMLELIGLGRIKDKRNKNIAFSHQPFRLKVESNDWKRFFPDKEEAFIIHIKNRIYKYIETELTQQNLYKQNMYFAEKYKPHKHSKPFYDTIAHWGENIQKEPYYESFKQAFLWDTILKYPFIDFARLSPENREKTIHFWAKIMGHLAREYYAAYKNDLLFEGSSLGLFAEMHKHASFYSDSKNKNIATQDKILKPYSDMVDAESIHYALVGKRKRLTTNKPVVVITCDAISDIERRLECLYHNLTYIGRLPKKYKSDKDLTINLCPGKIIRFNLESLKVTDNLKVQDFIEKIK